MSKIINLFGSPGTGKSTVAAELFAKLKWNKIRTELVTEYAKDLVWEERQKTIKNQIYVFGKQHNRIYKLLDKVDYIITDSPIVLGGFYAHKLGDLTKLEELIISEHNKQNNINIFLNRVKDYDPMGRIHTEKESDQYSIEIKKYLEKNRIKFIELDANENTVMEIFNRYL